MDTQLLIIIGLIIAAVAFLGYYFFKKFQNPDYYTVNPDNTGNDVTITTNFDEEQK
jgi:hypothetical protein